MRWKASKRGEIYELGRHRLMCGDATSSSDLAQLLGGRLADMCFTDPPYNVDYTGKTEAAMKIQNDRMGDDSFRLFLRDAFAAMRPHLRDGAPIYVCHADKKSAHFSGALWAADFVISQVLVWVKSHFALGRSDYHYQHEPILYGWKPGARHTWYGGRKQRSVWFFPKPSRNLLHPTMKPVPLVARAIENSSQKGDVVLDSFGGSGSTLIAAEDSDRTAYLMELDPGLLRRHSPAIPRPPGPQSRQRRCTPTSGVFGFMAEHQLSVTWYDDGAFWRGRAQPGQPGAYHPGITRPHSRGSDRQRHLRAGSDSTES